MEYVGLIAARSLKGQFQRISHIRCFHRGTEFPGNDVARVIIKDGREIEPSPTNDLEIGKIGLPHLVYGSGFVLELAGGLDDNEGWTGNQIMSLQQAID